MPNYRFEVGMHFLHQGRRYVVEQYLPDNEIQIKDLVTNEFLSKTMNTLVSALFEGKLEMIGDGENYPFLKQKLANSHAMDLAMMKDDPQVIAARHRLEYVKEITAQGLTKITPKSLGSLIKKVHKSIQYPKKKPSWTTVYRWYRDFMKSGQDPRALISAINKRGNANHKFSGRSLKGEIIDDADKAKADEVAAIVEKIVRKWYLSRGRLSVVSTHKKIESYIKEDNKRRRDKDKLPVPHLNSIYKYIKTLDHYEVDLARRGKRYADEKWRTHQQGPRPTRPLQRVQFDHTRMDLIVVDTKTRLPLGRPWLTTLIDVFTKMIIGFYISFTPPSYHAVMQCLLHAIRPKSYVKKLYPDIKHAWDAYGIPEIITVDNAKEFYSKDFDDACLQLGIVTEYAPRRAAWYKGSMERFYRTLDTELLHELPGTTFSKISDKIDYDPTKHAVISLDAVLEINHLWIIDIYHQSKHRGITDIPSRRWKKTIGDWPPNLPARNTELEVLLGFIEERIISPSGIEFYTLFYNSKDLGLIRRKLKHGEKAKIKINPDDISFIYVYDKSNDHYLPVPAIDQEYTKGLTLWQHLVIRNYARKEADSYVDREGLCDARKKLQTIVDREILLTKKLAGRGKVARYLNLGQPNYADLITEGISDNIEDTETPSRYEANKNSTPQSGNITYSSGISDIGTAFTLDGDNPSDQGDIDNLQLELKRGVEKAEEEQAKRRRRNGNIAGLETSQKSSSKKKVKESGNLKTPSVQIDIDEIDLDETRWNADYGLPIGGD